MKNTINTIKFLFWSCVVTLGLTYVISLLDKWFNLEWLPNSFLLAISSGIFASLFVLFVMELKKYFDTKTNLLNYIYYNCLSLYRELWVQVSHIDMHLGKKEELVSESLLEYRLPYITNITQNLRMAEYKIFKKQNAIEQAFSIFQRNGITSIDNYVSLCSYLPLSINKTQLFAAMQGALNYCPTANDSLVATALQKIKNSATLVMSEIDTLMGIIVSCNKKFNWKNEKEIILNSKPSFEEIKKQEDKFFNE